MARTIHKGGVMSRTVSRIAALLAIFVAQATFAWAAEIKVYATIGVKHSLEYLTANFEKTSGHGVSITWGTGAGLAKRIQAGEQADLLVLTRQGLDTLSQDGKVAVGTERDFTSSTQAVGIRKGAPRPDISTPEAFKATILNAKSVAYPDPAGGGLSGVFLTQLAEKKAKFPADNFAGKLVASGEAELAIQQKPELMSTEGVEILGPLPPEINVTTVFSAGVSKDAKESGPSSELLKYLESAEAAVVFERDGFDPPPRSASR
jgi:molybdate transport system substrate-binding protein